MRFYWLLLGVLSVWRVTHLLNAEDGPWNSIVWLRRRAGHGFWGQLLDCFLCLSLWIAAPLAWFLGSGALERLLFWPALSAAAILLQRVTENRTTAAAGLYFEDQENHDVLREEQTDHDPSAHREAHSAGNSRNEPR